MGPPSNEALKVHLRAAQALADAPNEMIDLLSTGATLRDATKGERIVEEGKPADSAVLVVLGQCTLVVDAPMRALLRLIGPGETIGLPHALARLPTYASVYAARTSTLILLSASALQAAAAAHVEMNLVAMREGARILKTFGDDWASSRVDDVAVRLLERLRNDARLGDLAQKDLADALGLRRETVSRVVSDLCERGLLVRKGQRLVVSEPSTPLETP